MLVSSVINQNASADIKSTWKDRRLRFVLCPVRLHNRDFWFAKEADFTKQFALSMQNNKKKTYAYHISEHTITGQTKRNV